MSFANAFETRVISNPSLRAIFDRRSPDLCQASAEGVIVAQELRAGVRAGDRKALERHVLKVYERASRMITPSADAWHRSGDLLAEMARKEGLEIARVSKAFANDVLLALSCREAGCILVTDNERDFQRIRRCVPFDFMKPWPGRYLTPPI